MNATLNILLKGTSRSFYLTLRMLPGAIRPQIGLAYLLARTSDTIADTELVPLEQRLDALHKLRERILGSSTAPLNFGELARQQGSPAEKLLLENAEDSLTLLQKLSPADLKVIRDALAIIMSGQELDLRRFAGASPKKSSRWKQQLNWMITRIASPAAWASSGRRCCSRPALRDFRTRGWTRGN